MVRVILIERDFLFLFELMLMNEDEKIHLEKNRIRIFRFDNIDFYLIDVMNRFVVSCQDQRIFVDKIENIFLDEYLENRDVIEYVE